MRRRIVMRDASRVFRFERVEDPLNATDDSQSECHVDLPKEASICSQGTDPDSPCRCFSALHLKSVRRISMEEIDTACSGDNGQPEWRTLSDAVRSWIPGEGSTGIMLVELQDIEKVRQALGSQVVREILVRWMHRLGDCLRKNDVVLRTGAHQFAVIIPEISSPARLLKIGKRIADSMTEPFSLGTRQISLHTAIGAVVCPIHGSESDQLVSRADTARRWARLKGRNCVQLFSEELSRAAQEKTDLEWAIGQALLTGQLAVHYQPMVDCRSGRITGAEALLRWNHPQKGQIAPDTFIPLAEESGLINQMGEWVLFRACDQNRRWQDMGLTPVRMAVNVTGCQFESGNMAEVIQDVLNDTGLDPRWLEVEITETVMMRDPEQILKNLLEIKRIGVSIAMDDFGTGYSCVNSLITFPLDRIKIDKSFLHQHGSPGGAAPVLEAIVGMGHSLKLNVLAEGVETENQLSLLQSLGCDEWQGYLFSRAVPGHKMTSLMGG